MKKLFALIVALCMLLSLVACGAAEPATPEATPDDATSDAAGDKEYKVGVIVFQNDMFMQMWTQGCNAAAEEYGWTVNNSNSNDDPAQLDTLIQTYIDQGYDAVVMQYTDPEVAMNCAKKAHEAGLAVGSGCVVTEEELQYYDLGLITAQSALGYAAGEAAVKYIQENNITDVKVGIVQFVAQSAWYSQQRSGNFLKALDDAGIAYEVAADQDANMQDTALTTCTDILTANPDINIIYGANDGATVGCTMAVKNLNLTDSVAVFGCDASEQICSLLLDDSYSLVGTAAQDAFGTGYKLTQAIMDKVLGNDNEYLGKDNSADGLPLNDYDVAAVDAYMEDLKAFN